MESQKSKNTGHLDSTKIGHREAAMIVYKHRLLTFYKDWSP